jgi:hypothetical protein
MCADLLAIRALTALNWRKIEKKEAFMKRGNEHRSRHRKSDYNKTSRRESHNPSTYQPTRDYRSQRDNYRNDRNTERDQETAMTARYIGFMLRGSKFEDIDSNVWIADTGASAHS